jgi:hypothetical protein
VKKKTQANGHDELTNKIYKGRQKIGLPKNNSDQKEKSNCQNSDWNINKISNKKPLNEDRYRTFILFTSENNIRG